MTTKHEEKVTYLKDKVNKIEQQLRKNGININIPSLITNVNLEVIKDILIEQGFITKQGYQIRYLEKDLEILTEIKENNSQKIANVSNIKKKLVIPRS